AVLRGTPELTVDGLTYLLQPGDSDDFDSRRPHRFRNVDRVPVQAPSVNTPKRLISKPEEPMATVASSDCSLATRSSAASSRNLIGGSWVEGGGSTRRDICNPADTAEVLATVRWASPDQVDEACAAAAQAFPGWRATPAPDRARVLFKFRDL